MAQSTMARATGTWMDLASSWSCLCLVLAGRRAGGRALRNEGIAHNLSSQRRPDSAPDNATRGRLWTARFAMSPVR